MDIASGASWTRQTLLWRPSASALSGGRKISQLEEAVGSRLEEEGHSLAPAVADHVLMCFRSRNRSISLEPVVQGPVKEFAEAARDGVEDDARVVAEQFEREPEDA
jgi:hypothetical protein